MVKPAILQLFLLLFVFPCSSIANTDTSLQKLDDSINLSLTKNQPLKLKKSLRSRTNLCKKTSNPNCTDISGFKDNLCESDKINIELQIDVWKTIIGSVSNPPLLKKQLKILDHCKSKEKSREIAFKATMGLTALDLPNMKTNPKLYTALKTWIYNLNPRFKNKTLNLIIMVRDSVNFLYNNQKRIPFGMISNLHNQAADWAIQLLPQMNKLTPNQKKDLGEWIARSSFHLQMTGNLPKISFLVKRDQKWVDFIPDFQNKITLIESLCVHWYYTNQKQHCSKFLKKVKPSNSNQQMRFNLSYARILYTKGDAKEAVDLSMKTIRLAKRAKNKHYMNWAKFGLSNYLPPLGKLDQAEKYLRDFKEYLKSTDLGWLEVIQFTREQSISIDKERCDASLKWAKRAQNFLRKRVSGNTSELLWSQYMELFCYVKNRDKRMAQIKHSQIKKSLSTQPTMKHVGTLSELLIDSMDGKIHSSDYQKSISEINIEDPEFRRVRQFLQSRKIM